MVKNSKKRDGRYHGVFDIITSKEILTLAYGAIKSNSGIMTVGSDGQTLDGISMDFIIKLSKKLRSGEFKFSPSREVLIPKLGKYNELRPLNIANPREKIVQKSVQIVLEAILDGFFLNCSHG